MSRFLLVCVLLLAGVACQTGLPAPTPSPAAPTVAPSPTAVSARPTTVPAPTREMSAASTPAAAAATARAAASPTLAPATVAPSPAITPSPAVPSPTPARRLAVVATFSTLGDLVKNVGGERVEVVVLVGPGQDTHTFKPSPADVARLARAELVFENGLEFEGWLDKQYAASGTRARRVVATEGMTPQKAGHAHAEGAAEPAHDHGEFDPHVWHDVKHVMHMVATIRDALARADPTGAAVYKANAERYLAELTALDAWVVEQVRGLPEERRTLVTNHDTFGYFASRYGFAVVGTALPVSTEAAEPSAGELAKLVQRIRRAGAPAVFTENVSNPKLMERIAKEAGVKVAPPLYTDALGPPGGEAETYVKMMRYNVATIVSALKS